MVNIASFGKDVESTFDEAWAERFSCEANQIALGSPQFPQ